MEKNTKNKVSLKTLKRVGEPYVIIRDKRRELRATILENEEKTQLIVDIRWFKVIDDIATREGVCLYHSELSYLNDMIQNRKECFMQTGRRRLEFQRVWTHFRVVLVNGYKKSELNLTNDEVDSLKQNMPKILEIMDNHVRQDMPTYHAIPRTMISASRLWEKPNDIAYENKLINFM